MRVVAAIPAVGLLSGCAAGLIWPDAPKPFLLAILCVSAVAAAAAVIQRRAAIVPIPVAMSFAGGGALLAQHAWEDAWRPPLRVAFESIARDERAEAVRAGRARPEDDSAAVSLVGVLQEDAALSPSGAVSMRLAVTWIARAGPRDGPVHPAANPVFGGVTLSVNGTLAGERMGAWRAGRTVRASAQLRRSSRYLDPGVPDQERALARRGVTLVGTVKSAALIDILARGSPAAELAATARARARRAIAGSVGRWSPASAGIVTAIVIGDRSGLDPAVQRRLQEAGTYHVIAISGGNIAILAGLTLTLFRIAGVLGRTAMVTAIVGLIAYGYVVGGGASVDRATLMAAIYFAGRALDLRGPPLNTLAITAALLALIDPLAVADPGFLLTCGATTAILLASPVVPLRGLPSALAPVAALGVASLCAEIALFPIGAALFSRVTFAGLLLNFVAIPSMAVAQIAGMLAVPLWLISSRVAAIAGVVAHVGAAGLVRSADLVTYAPAVTWRVASPSSFVLAVYYAGGVAAWWLWRCRVEVHGSGDPTALCYARRGSVVLVALAAAWMLVEPWRWWSARGDGRLHVTFLDVGQGDAALVVFPRGSTLLVDTGGAPGASSFDIGDRVVAPVLRHAGIRRLGTLALTHGDADHVGGAPSIVEEFHPWEVWEGVPVARSDLLERARIAARGARSRWTTLQSSDETLIDDVRVVVRHPPRPDWERQDVRNDDSIVLELLWHDVSIVLTGDIGRETERTLVGQFPPARLRVVKVPHHGSLTSSSEAFVHALSPRLAIVSAGRSNNFGHPAQAVLTRYEHIGAAIFRTDQDGAVTVHTDGRVLDVRGFTGRSVAINRQTAHNGVTKNTKP